LQVIDEVEFSSEEASVAECDPDSD
jgi:hypothetical protein